MLSELPKELIIEIFKYLSVKDYLQFRLVNRQACDILKLDHMTDLSDFHLILLRYFKRDTTLMLRIMENIDIDTFQLLYGSRSLSFLKCRFPIQVIINFELFFQTLFGNKNLWQVSDETLLPWTSIKGNIHERRISYTSRSSKLPSPTLEELYQALLLLRDPMTSEIYLINRQLCRDLCHLLYQYYQPISLDLQQGQCILNI